MAKQRGACKACLESGPHANSTKQLGIFSFLSCIPCHRHLFHRLTWEGKGWTRKRLKGKIMEGATLGCVMNSWSPHTQRSAEEQWQVGEATLCPCTTYVCHTHTCACLLVQPEYWLEKEERKEVAEKEHVWQFSLGINWQRSSLQGSKDQQERMA